MMEIRTVLMTKDGIMGAIGLALSEEQAQVARLDLREGQPVSSEFDTPELAVKGFRNMLRTSKRHPLFG